MYNEKYFSDDQFSYYSPCPNLEGIKDALSYKFRRLMIGQNNLLCRVHKQGCQGLGAHRDAFSSSSERRKRRAFRQATEPRAKREVMFVLCHGLVVDSTFERSENVAITR